ncbi:hypothetical protein G3I15_33640 [Streptomyces sp. SID10244]|nr:hypothetical protein [Streptomyces sp. SID10244]
MSNTTDIDWDTWLGPAADQLTDEQRERFEDEAETIMTRYPDLDDQSEIDAALSAVVQYLLGETTIDQAGEARRATRDAERLALVTAQQIARLATQDGMAEAEAARRAGIDRMVVRRLLGK